MPRCSVLMCKNDSRSINVSNGGVSYHRFPKDPLVKERWIESTGRQDWFPGATSTVCSQHFDPQDITLSHRGYKYLRDSTVPTRNVLSFHASIAESKTSRSSKSEAEVVLSETKSTKKTRKRASHSSEDPSPAKSQKVLNDDDDSDDEETSLTSLEKKLECMLRYEKNKAKKQNGKLKQLKRKYNRLKMSIPDMNHLYKILNEKRYLQGEDIMWLELINVQVSELVARRQTNVELSEVVSKLTYSKELRNFALSLHFLSAEAYDYVRKAFKTSLPHPRTLKHWHLRTDGEPGFTKEAFIALKKKSDAASKPILAALVIDEMDIRCCVEVDDGRPTRGYMDIGTGLHSDMLPEAKAVLAFMVTAVNGHFKIPVAYFLTAHISQGQCAGLVKRCIEMAHDSGIKIVAVTVDSKPTNEIIIKQLGCNIDTGEGAFEHPVTKEPIVIVIDPSHSLKTLFRSVREHETLIDKDDKKVQWKHLKELNETLYLDPKLKDQYVDFKNERVKVKRMTRPFSASVAAAMQYCRRDLELEAFKDSESTQTFLTVCNTVSDLTYSINSHVYGYKTALNKNNVRQIFEALDMAFEYITELKGHGHTLIKPQTFKSFVNSVKLLYKTLIETDVLESLSLYKLSTDHLKQFWIDATCTQYYLTPVEVIHAYKRVVEEMKAKKGKNPAIEHIAIPKCASPVDRINRVAGQLAMAKQDRIKDDPGLDGCVSGLSDSREEAVVQIAGFIVQQLIRKLTCDVCVEALVTTNRAMINFLIAKDGHRLLYPSLGVVKICKTAERCLNGFDGSSSRQGVGDDVMMAKIMRQFVASPIFDEIGYHQVGEFPESNHVADLMRAVVQRYSHIHYLARAKRETFKDVIGRIKDMWNNRGIIMPFGYL